MEDLLPRNLFIGPDSTILNALKKMDYLGRKLLIVVRDDKFAGLISIGDIQRAILKGTSLDTQVSQILRSRVIVASSTDSAEDIKAQMLTNRTEFMPVVDIDNNIVRVVFWEELFHEDFQRIREKLHLPVVIMAGGRGKRLEPITNVLPKPLIPIGKKTILENIMDRFLEAGCYDFHISVNYKAEMIRQYFMELKHPEYQIEFFDEPKPLGTAGSLSMLKGKIKGSFFVSNCDILIDADYMDMVDYHRQNMNAMTIVSALAHFPIPYGIVETSDNGKLSNIKEKPDLTFQINTGMYILEPEVLDLIPGNTFYHITELMSDLQEHGHRVGVFPVSAGSWTDIGNWSQYLEHIRIDGKKD